MRTCPIACLLGACDLVFTLDETPADGGSPSGLVAHYLLDELAGTQTEDATGNGHTAVCQQGRCPTLQFGLFGGAMRFDGSSTFMRADSQPDVESGAFTITAWVFLDRLPLGLSCAISKLVGDDVQNTWQLCVDATGRVYFTTFDGMVADILDTPTALTPSRWHHLAGRWDGEKTVFIDGFPERSRVANTVFDDGAIFIGADNDSVPVNFFDGALDDIRIYNLALDNSAIVELARPPE